MKKIILVSLLLVGNVLAEEGSGIIKRVGVAEYKKTYSYIEPVYLVRFENSKSFVSKDSSFCLLKDGDWVRYKIDENGVHINIIKYKFKEELTKRTKK